jgi:4'-phosphopantetheinyl transferase
MMAAVNVRRDDQHGIIMPSTTPGRSHAVVTLTAGYSARVSVRVEVVSVAADAAPTALRATLGRALGRPPEQIDITRVCERCGDLHHGRPRMSRGEIAFSVSHSAGTAVIALTPDAPRIGVDIELVRARPFLGRLAARTLAPDAYAAWRAAPETERLERFLRAWTMKEAYLKGIGIGIATTLADVPDEPSGWTVQPIDAPPGYVASVAVATAQRLIVCDGTAG